MEGIAYLRFFFFFFLKDSSFCVSCFYEVMLYLHELAVQSDQLSFASTYKIQVLSCLVFKIGSLLSIRSSSPSLCFLGWHR